LDAAVPAPVVVGTVTVALAVRFVVLLVVGNKVVKREAVVTRHEVDALLGFAPLVAIDFGAADQPVGDAAERATFAADEVADIVAEPAVPLLPGVADEASDLIEPGRVPRLGEKLRASQGRVRLDVPEHGGVRQR